MSTQCHAFIPKSGFVLLLLVLSFNVTVVCPLQKLCFVLRSVLSHSSRSEFTIIKCGLSCRTSSHFHCCYCAETIIYRSQFLKHLEKHQEEKHAAAHNEQTKAPTQRSAAPAQNPRAPTQHPVAPAECPDTTKTYSHTKHKKVTCPHCKVSLNKKRFQSTLQMKTYPSLSDSVEGQVFVDVKHGVFAVERSFFGPATPLHMIKNTWIPTQKIMCEVNQCRPSEW